MDSNGKFFADKVMDLANLVAGSLFFGPIVSGEMNWLALLIGFNFFWISIIFSLFLRRERGK